MAKREKELSTGRVYFDRGGTGPEKIIKAEHVNTPMAPYFPDDTTSPVTLNFLDNEKGSEPLMVMDPENNRVIISNLHLYGDLTGQPGPEANPTFDSITVNGNGDIDNLFVDTIRVKDWGVAKRYGFGNYYEWLHQNSSLADNQLEIGDWLIGPPVHIRHDTTIGPLGYNPTVPGSISPLYKAHLLVGVDTNGIGMDNNQIAKTGGNLYFELDAKVGQSYYFKAGGENVIRMRGKWGTINSSAIYLYNHGKVGNWSQDSEATFWRLRMAAAAGSPGTPQQDVEGDDAEIRLWFDYYYIGDNYDSYDVGHTQYVAYLSPDSNTKHLNADFTGQHRCRPHSTTSLAELSPHIGKIVVSAGVISNPHIDKQPSDMRAKVQINESIPTIVLSSEEEQKSVFGVIAAAEKEEQTTRDLGVGAFRTPYTKVKGDTRLLINSLGEGAIWVCNKAGNLENGDYITTSAFAGYGMKQSDDILHNYTVAKITMDCDFDLASTTYDCIETEHEDRRGNKYKAAFVSCTYHCG